MNVSAITVPNPPAAQTTTYQSMVTIPADANVYGITADDNGDVKLAFLSVNATPTKTWRADLIPMGASVDDLVAVSGVYGPAVWPDGIVRVVALIDPDLI